MPQGEPRGAGRGSPARAAALLALLLLAAGHAQGEERCCVKPQTLRACCCHPPLAAPPHVATLPLPRSHSAPGACHGSGHIHAAARCPNVLR